MNDELDAQSYHAAQLAAHDLPLRKRILPNISEVIAQQTATMAEHNEFQAVQARCRKQMAINAVLVARGHRGAQTSDFTEDETEKLFTIITLLDDLAGAH